MFLKGSKTVVITMIFYIVTWIILRSIVKKPIFDEDFYLVAGVFVVILIIKEIVIPIIGNKKEQR